MVVKKNDLGRFLKKLEHIDTQQNKIVEKIVRKGEEIAREQYIGTDIVVSSTLNGNTGSILAKGDQVAFMEFGTGINGANAPYPAEKLPQSGVPITGSWQYYYPSKYKRTLKDGQQGWFHKDKGDTIAKFHTGQIAGKQMFFTAKELREYIHNDLRKEVR